MPTIAITTIAPPIKDPTSPPISAPVVMVSVITIISIYDSFHFKITM